MHAIPAFVLLTLQWCDPHGLFEHGWERIGAELSRTFDPIGFPVHLAKGEASEGERAIRVVLVQSEPGAWGLPPGTLGAVLSPTDPEAQVFVFFPSVARILGYRPESLRKRWTTPREERDLARAVSRVIAHEVIHAVLPSRPHGEHGLTGFRLDRASLLASRIAIDPVVALELRAALSGPAASRSN